ncbi:hypothetical protein ACIP93_33550 [Streptomyces sp. NPDC088745]|uniref:hypothetical protein n=1 Tax=Streptomyces sp. NPDC088745 TaxID=3365884 RepID=UPI003816D1F1
MYDVDEEGWLIDRGRYRHQVGYADCGDAFFDEGFAGDSVFTEDWRVRPQRVEHWSELLFQSTWWQDAERNIWHLDGLDAMRCSGIYEFIARREDETGTLLAWSATRVPVPTGDADGRGQDQVLAMVGERGWILRTDLMVALQRRMRGLPAVEGTCFCGYPVAEGWDHSACHDGMEIA